MAERKINKLIEEISKFLKSGYEDFRGIYFYGSRARGDYNEDSDYDLVFVFDREIDWRFKEEIKHIIYRHEDIYDLFIDSKIISSEEIDLERMPLIINIKRDGIFYGV